MIRDAVLYLASLDDRAAARLTLARRPLAFRIVMAAVRAGVTRVQVPEALRAPPLEALVTRTPSARNAVQWVTAAVPPPSGDVLFLPAGVLVTAAALKPLVATKRTQMLDGLPSDAPIAATASHVAAQIWRDTADGAAVGVDLARALAVTGAKRIQPAGVAAPIDAAGIADAEAQLYRTLGSAIDSPLDRAVHRRLSRRVTRWSVALGIAPNAITVASLAIGLAGAAVLASGGLRGTLAGLALYVVAVVLDHADGEVARISFTESRLGEWLDIGGDTLVHAALVLGMGYACERATGAGATAGVIATAGVLASAWTAKTVAPSSDRVAGFFDALGNRDGFYAMLIAFALGLAFAPGALPGLMILVAIGTHAYWIGSALARRRRTT